MPVTDQATPTTPADLACFADLVRGASLRAQPHVLTPATTLRLGRAIGTVVRRHGQATNTVLIGRGPGAADASVRDGLVAGLVLGGLHVVDLGVVESDRFMAALRVGPNPSVRGAHAWPAAAGVLVGTASDSVGVMVFAGGRPLVGAHLVEVAAVAERGAFVGCPGGDITVVDTHLLAWASTSNDGDDGDDGDNTVDDNSTVADQ